MKAVQVFQLTTAWARYTATFQVPVIAGKMLGTNDCLRLAFDLPLNVVQTVDLAESSWKKDRFPRRSNTVQLQKN